MTINTFGKNSESITLSELSEGVASDWEDSVFLVNPKTRRVTQASPVCMEEFRKMGFTEKKGILGHRVSELYSKCAAFLFPDDKEKARGLALQQRQAWKGIQRADSHMTSHLISGENGGRRVAIQFLRLVNKWEEVLVYVVEIRMERLTAQQYQEEIEHGRIFVPPPLKRVA
jgi:hypothetical protein